MSSDVIIVFSLLLATIALFISDRLRMDVVAIMLILALMLTGLLSPAEALAGFGDPLVILIAGLFVLGEGLLRTGVALSLGNSLMGMAGQSETRLLVLLMLVVAGLSAFMSNTGAVAILIPVALNLASRISIPPSRLLLPMAYAGSIGGMLTLIGTPPNLVVATELTRAGLEPFGFFSFTPVGLLVLGTTMGLILTLGAVLLPQKSKTESDKAQNRLSLSDLVDAYAIRERFHLLRAGPNSSFIGLTVGEALLRTRFGVTVIALERRAHGRPLAVPAMAETTYNEGDLLFLTGSKSAVAELMEAEAGLTPVPLEQEHGTRFKSEVGLAEVLVAPRSELNGRTIRQARFREDYGLAVLGLLRDGQPLRDDLLDTRLEFGDSLLVAGGWHQIECLRRSPQNFLVLALPREIDEVAPHRDRAFWALGIVGIMLLIMTLGVVPTVTAVLLAGLAMVLTRCVTMEEAYRAINWQSVVLIAGMLPMATALEKTGALELTVNGLVEALGDYGPVALMGGLFLLTTVFSQFISNTATAVLVAPIAMGAAATLGVSPYPMLMTVALAASTAFSTPMASPVNTLVIGPGGYNFSDFLVLGVPLQLVAMIITLFCVPFIFPL